MTGRYLAATAAQLPTGHGSTAVPLFHSIFISPSSPTMPLAAVEAICERYGSIFAATGAPQGWIVTFVDARSAQQAASLLPITPEFAQYSVTQCHMQAHALTGTMVLEQAHTDGKMMDLDQLMQLMSTLGDVAWLQPIGTATGFSNPAACCVLEFYNAEVAANAVQIASAMFSTKLRLTAIDPASGKHMIETVFANQLRPSSSVCSLTGGVAHVSEPGPSEIWSGNRSCATGTPGNVFSLPTPGLAPSPPLLPTLQSEQRWPSDSSVMANACASHISTGASPLAACTRRPSATAQRVLANEVALNNGASGLARTPQQATPQPDPATEFDVEEAMAGCEGARTTVMIRNVPCRWTAEKLLTLLRTYIGSSWDLFYMPYKTFGTCNTGYAFLNLKDSRSAAHLYFSIHGRGWPGTRSAKVCEVRYARLQGSALMAHFVNRQESGAGLRGVFISSGPCAVHGLPHPAPVTLSPLSGLTTLAPSSEAESTSQNSVTMSLLPHLKDQHGFVDCGPTEGIASQISQGADFRLPSAAAVENCDAADDAQNCGLSTPWTFRT